MGNLPTNPNLRLIFRSSCCAKNYFDKKNKTDIDEDADSNSIQLPDKNRQVYDRSGSKREWKKRVSFQSTTKKK